MALTLLFLLQYIILNHGHEMLAGFENLYKSVLPMYRNKPGKHQYRDIHNRLMAKYAEGMPNRQPACVSYSDTNLASIQFPGGGT